MGSPTWWAWVWVNSGSWWWTGRPGMLQFMGLQSRTRLSDWTELIPPNILSTLSPHLTPLILQHLFSLQKGPFYTSYSLGPLVSKVNDFSERGTYIPVIFYSHLQARDNSKHTYVRNWEFKETLHPLTHVHTFPPSSATPNLESLKW